MGPVGDFAPTFQPAMPVLRRFRISSWMAYAASAPEGSRRSGSSMGGEPISNAPASWRASSHSGLPETIIVSLQWLQAVADDGGRAPWPLDTLGSPGPRRTSRLRRYDGNLNGGRDILEFALWLHAKGQQHAHGHEQHATDKW